MHPYSISVVALIRKFVFLITYSSGMTSASSMTSCTVVSWLVSKLLLLFFLQITNFFVWLKRH